MEWTAGYASDVEYTAGFYPEQSPAHLNQTCILNGFEPVDITKPFTYFELGFGRGVTVTTLAAANPNGLFYATDFNPAHVAGARQLADSAALANLVLLENSFEELARGEVPGLPQFDFITLHGIYTWVTRDNQAHIAAFIRRCLKPGGIVYLSYNAMPGWAGTMPLQRLIVDHAAQHPQRSDVQVKTAVDYLASLAETGRGYFANNTQVKDRIESLKKASANYLVHEYMHRHWKPMYHADVACDLGEAKLEFVGSAEQILAFPPLYMAPEQVAMLLDIPDRSMRETVKDFLLNTPFRKDVFVRGPRRMPATRQLEWLQKTGIALTGTAEAVKPAFRLGNQQIVAKPEMFDAAMERLNQGPVSFAEICALPVMRDQHITSIVQFVTLLTAANAATVYFADRESCPTDAAHRLNRVVAECVRHSDEVQCLAAPLLGSGIITSMFDRIALGGLFAGIDAGDTTAHARRAWQILRSQGRYMRKDGEAVVDEETNLVLLKEALDKPLRQKLPAWRTLGIC
jgi:SAM-dependent methyltransferase